ncbi:unnamed protein product [Orchesella dallaii]|uniref:Carboxylesterase type B domain-containing protein n=1 Tax=Orchesella dallaii TaxID=48710 RepID=A0ABP1R705_9HEXA
MFRYNKNLLVLALFFSLHTVTLQSESTLNIVTLSNGNRLTGISLTSTHTERSYVEFRGIPFAKPPIGAELRFQPPAAFDEKWGPDPRDATEYGNVCPQLDPWYNPDEVEGGSWDELRVLGDEDCLYANVATPDLNPDNLLPVLVWIHGGNFQTESGNEYGAGKLMDYDIVMVTFNYRLGPFGFLNLEDGNIQGNMGLKDQSILLKWVQDNIKSFGGDPDKVTLGGANAGAVSVHLHMLSEYSKGLFHQAIIQSGTAISPWAIMKEPNERAEKLAKHLKCGNDTTVEKCLSDLDAVKIIQKMPKLAEWYIDPLTPFAPSLEKSGDSKFLSRNPFTLLTEDEYWAKNIPVVIGVNSHEGLLHALDIGNSGMLRRVFNLEWYGAAPISLYYKKTAMDPRMVSEAVRAFYFPVIEEERINGSLPLVDRDYHFSNLTNLYSDRHFFVPLHHSAITMGKHNKLYLYWFDYVSGQTIHGLYGYNSSQISGPSHYDQLQYMFVTPFFNETKGEENLEFEKNFLNGLYKFINDGSPLYNDWTHVTEEMVEGTVPLIYNRIGKSSDAPNLVHPFLDRVQFWSGQFIMEYYKGGFVDELMEQGEKMANSEKDEL